jgi:hypothetical protein
MEENRMPKKIFTHELEGTRRRGRPRKEWREEVERDLQVLGVRRWRELVIDREIWRGIIRQATAGCSANGRRRRKCLFESFTCFEQPCAHPQEDNCINITSGINTVC